MEFSLLNSANYFLPREVLLRQKRRELAAMAEKWINYSLFISSYLSQSSVNVDVLKKLLLWGLTGKQSERNSGLFSISLSNVLSERGWGREKGRATGREREEGYVILHFCSLSVKHNSLPWLQLPQILMHLAFIPLAPKSFLNTNSIFLVFLWYFYIGTSNTVYSPPLLLSCSQWSGPLR